MKKLTQLAILSIALFASSVAFADFRGRAMTTEIKKDLNANRKLTPGEPWRTRVGGKAGDRIRPYTASSVRSGPGQLAKGFHVTGTFNTKTGVTRVKSIAVPRVAR